MKSPPCVDFTLDERERDKVFVDLCGQCCRLWLDRGELEKLLHRPQGDLEEEQAGQRSREDTSVRDIDRDDVDHDHNDEYRRRPHEYRKKLWFESLTNLFDGQVESTPPFWNCTPWRQCSPLLTTAGFTPRSRPLSSSFWPLTLACSTARRTRCPPERRESGAWCEF